MQITISIHFERALFYARTKITNMHKSMLNCKLFCNFFLEMFVLKLTVASEELTEGHDHTSNNYTNYC